MRDDVNEHFEYGAIVDKTKREAGGAPTMEQALRAADLLVITDAYSFAELAVWDLGVFGSFTVSELAGDVGSSDLESAWLEAEAAFARHQAEKKETP